MTFEEWWEQRFTKEMTPVKYALVKDVREAWNAATAEAEKRAKERKAGLATAEARRDFVEDMLQGKFGMLSRETERTMVYIKQRLKVELAALPASGQAEGPLDLRLSRSRP
jgi:hypothetical protein